MKSLAEKEISKFKDLQLSLSKFGAADTEPDGAFRYLMRKAVSGEPFPQKLSENFFELYESMRGWKDAESLLLHQAKKAYDSIQSSTILEVKRISELLDL